jgi:NitT/TauT family transport system substrate-binding protein
MLISGDVDAITGFAFSSYLNVVKKVPPGDATVMLMTDYGVKLYGNAIIVHPKFATDKPEAVKGFLRAYVKGLNYTIANPGDAIASVLSRNGVANKEAELERLNYALEKNMLTAEVKSIGFGAVDMTRLEASIDQLALTYKFEGKPKASDIFDASFLPPAAARSAK